MKSVQCPRCRRAHPAIRDAAGKVVVLPHMPKGGALKWDERCRPVRQ